MARSRNRTQPRHVCLAVPTNRLDTFRGGSVERRADVHQPEARRLGALRLRGIRSGDEQIRDVDGVRARPLLRAGVVDARNANAPELAVPLEDLGQLVP